MAGIRLFVTCINMIKCQSSFHFHFRDDKRMCVIRTVSQFYGCDSKRTLVSLARIFPPSFEGEADDFDSWNLFE